MKFLYFAAAVLLAPTAAFADLPKANACAQQLSPHGKMIYDATQPRIKSESKIADEIRAAVRPMVMGGKLSRADAQAAADPAGKCLAMIQQ